MTTPSLFDAPLETPAAWPPPQPAATDTASTGPRWFVRCVECLTIAAVTEAPDCYNWQCGLCKGQIENMGKVERDRGRQPLIMSSGVEARAGEYDPSGKSKISARPALGRSPISAIGARNGHSNRSDSSVRP